MSEEQINFKVTDRRLFNPDGSPRDVPEDERPVEKIAPPAPAAAAIPEAGPEAVASSVEQLPLPQANDNVQEQPDSDADADLPGASDPASFASFMMSIASNAASSLGMMEHPVTGKREVDLELGKHWIDILTMLKEKTRGNLQAQEQQVLESLLADLQMQYVSLTNAVAAKAKGYSSRDITGG